jgi:hypothetical protein
MIWREPASELRRLLRQLDARAGMLDPDTGNALVDGAMSPEDAPPDLRDLTLLMAELRAAPTEAELADAGAGVATLAAVIRTASPPPERRPAPARRPRRRARTVTAVLVGTMTLFGGLAAANALPGSVQRVTADVLGTVGVSVPSPRSDWVPKPPGRDEGPPAGPEPGVAGGSGTADKVTRVAATSVAPPTTPEPGHPGAADAGPDHGGEQAGAGEPPPAQDESDHADHGKADHAPHDGPGGPGGPDGNQFGAPPPDHGHDQSPGDGKGHGGPKTP